MVVLMSTYDVEDLPAAASNCGAVAYLHKERLSPELLSRIWRDSELKAPPPGGMVPHWRVPQVLLTTAVRSSSLLGHDLIHRFRAERYQLFLSGHLALWASAGVVLPLLEYAFWYRTPYVLLFAAVGAPQCVALAFGLRLARLR